MDNQTQSPIQPPMTLSDSDTPSVPPNHVHSLWSYIVLGIFIFITLGIVGVIVMYPNQSSSDTFRSFNANKMKKTPTPTKTSTTSATISNPDTSNWKTYASQVGFSFKYPSDWTIRDMMYEKVPTIKDSQFFNFGNRGNMVDGVWMQMQFDTALTEKEIISRANDTYSEGYSKGQIQTENYNGKKLIRVTSTSYQKQGNTYVESWKGYFIYIPVTEGYIQLHGNLVMKDTIEKIFSTFKPDQNQTISPTPASQEKTCGGLANIQCPTGYTCKFGGNYPDASGTCVK